MLRTSKLPKWPAQKIRDVFLQHFTENLNHKLIKSSPVVPLLDKSVAFTNAGMNQFKTVFLGEDAAPGDRVVSIQKCIRVGGKHNDLSLVGLDSTHHTFFEMLGNWSFNRSSKRESCIVAWETLTQVFEIPPELLGVTVFSGNEFLDADLESLETWRELGIAEKRIRMDSKDNFWEMGLTGPCGPCTEIHLVSPANPDLWTELWNVVFIEAERLPGGDFKRLDKRFVDTGMGLERLTTFLQQKTSNYDTDLFLPIIRKVEEITKCPKYSGRFDNDLDVNFRVIADHSRMIAAALADGVIPEKNYKLRKIIRRVQSIAEGTFKDETLLEKLMEEVAEVLGDAYPEIPSSMQKIQTILSYERDLIKRLQSSSNKKWNSILHKRPEMSKISDPFATGLSKSYEELQTFIKSNPEVDKLPGDIIFKMNDLFGLHLDLVEELAEIEHLQLDLEGFERLLNIKKLKSRMMSLEKSHFLGESVDFLKKNNVKPTDDSFKYEVDTLRCKIVGLIDQNDSFCSTLKSSEMSSKIGVILDKTPFYCFKGGQTSDRGVLRTDKRVLKVSEVFQVENYIIHHVEMPPGVELNLQEDISAEIDIERRKSLAKHHTATHLLNAALRKIFQAVFQQSSAVFPDHFTLKVNTFGQKVRPKHLMRIFQDVNDAISSKTDVFIKTPTIFQFLADDELTFLPGSVYPGGNLRVVDIQTPNLKSREPCCGTHVKNTSLLGHFNILNIQPDSYSSYIITASTNPERLTSNLEKNNFVYENLKDILDANKKKELIEEFVNLEIEKVFHLSNENNDLAIVHVIEMEGAEAESIPLQKAIEKLGNSVEKPVFLIAKSSRKIRVRCLVPQKFVTANFNAEIWLKNLEVTGLKIGQFSDENPLLISHSKILKLPNAKIEGIVDEIVAKSRILVEESLISSRNP